MTKVPVNVPNFAANMMYGGGVRVQSTDATGEFGKIFETQKNSASEVKTQETGREDDVVEPQEDAVKEVENKDAVNEVQSSNDVKEASNTQTEQNADGENPEGELSEEEMNLIMPMLQAAAGDIKDVLAQELGITTEELDGLLEGMGLDELDLLNQGTLKDVLLQVKGLDMTALLTNEELYGQIQNLEGAFGEVMSNVQDTLQMTDEEMNALQEQLADMNKPPVVTVEETASAHTQQEPDSQNMQNPFAAPNQNLVNVQEIMSQANVARTDSGFMSAQTENIMNQIMDYMRIQLTEETNTIELQLQPESLGTLQIRISAKEGIMTAQFTTASETVKAALESQMVQLQQQFDSQNIKVEAIEVLVQTHQFESALEQGDEKQQQEADSKKNRIRKIDLNQLEEAEEISEEDRIVAEMMAANGSTVDYLA